MIDNNVTPSNSALGWQLLYTSAKAETLVNTQQDTKEWPSHSWYF